MESHNYMRFIADNILGSVSFFVKIMFIFFQNEIKCNNFGFYLQVKDENNWIMFMVPIVEMFWALGLVFISCELASRLSNEFDKINGTILQFNWYTFPLELQQQLPTVIISAHKELGFVCFGSIMCNRETFKKVCKLFNAIYSKQC